MKKGVLAILAALLLLSGVYAVESQRVGYVHAVSNGEPIYEGQGMIINGNFLILENFAGRLTGLFTVQVPTSMREVIVMVPDLEPDMTPSELTVAVIMRMKEMYE